MSADLFRIPPLPEKSLNHRPQNSIRTKRIDRPEENLGKEVVRLTPDQVAKLDNARRQRGSTANASQMELMDR